MNPEPTTPEPSPPDDPVPASRFDRRAWGAAVALAALLLAVDGAMVWAFRVRPWTLVVPGAVLAIALRGRSASLASWRDALGLLCLATVPLVALLSPDTPRPLRFALNSLGTAGAVLLALGLILDEGIGAGVRRRSWPVAREALRQAWTRHVQAGSLLIWPVGYSALDGLATIPRPFLWVPALALLAGLVPEREGRARTGLATLGCLGFLVVVGGAIAGVWPWTAVPFVLLSLSLTDEMRKAIAPVPPKTKPTGLPTPAPSSPEGAFPA